MKSLCLKLKLLKDYVYVHIKIYNFKRWIDIKIIKNDRFLVLGRILIVILMTHGMHIHIKPIDGLSPSS